MIRGSKHLQEQKKKFSEYNSFFFDFFGMQADVDNSGTIDYGEFIAATLHLNKIEKEDYLFRAFSYFDKDGSGYITQDELQKACEEFGIEDVHLEELMREADQNDVSAALLLHLATLSRSFFYQVVLCSEWIETCLFPNTVDTKHKVNF